MYVGACHVTEVIQPLWPAETTRSQGGLENDFLEQSFCRSTIASMALMVISIWESDSSNIPQPYCEKCSWTHRKNTSSSGC